MVEFEEADDQSRRQVCDALTAREPNRGTITWKAGHVRAWALVHTKEAPCRLGVYLLLHLVCGGQLLWTAGLTPCFFRIQSPL